MLFESSDTGSLETWCILTDLRGSNLKKINHWLMCLRVCKHQENDFLLSDTIVC